MNHYLSRFLFGTTEFRESEEYFEFRYKFLCVLMVLGIISALQFFVLHQLGAINIDSFHVVALALFSVAVTTLWRLLLWKKEWFWFLAWTFEILALFLIVSSTILIPQDELRMVWFYINVSAVYVVAGRKAGLMLALVTGFGFAIGNRYLPSPYSSNALITAEICLGYWSLFFHSHASRSFSYFSRMQEYNQRLHRQATHDPLTNVFNARAYYDICGKMLENAKITGISHSVLFIDLDHFKRINDHYSHQTGDEVLQSVAECMRKHLRKTDVLGRIGGEEFSVLLPATVQKDAILVAETLRKAIEALRPAVTNSHPLRVTASIGVASTHAHWNESMAIIQRRADAAMYAAKKKGRNRVDAV